MSRRRHIHSKPSRTTICATAGTVAAASVAASVMAAGPALVTPVAAAGGEPGSLGRTADIALAAGGAIRPQAGHRLGTGARLEIRQRLAADQAQAPLENPALLVRQAMNERYAQAVRAARRKAAAERAARLYPGDLRLAVRRLGP